MSSIRFELFTLESGTLPGTMLVIVAIPFPTYSLLSLALLWALQGWLLLSYHPASRAGCFSLGLFNERPRPVGDHRGWEEGEVRHFFPDPLLYGSSLPLLWAEDGSL